MCICIFFYTFARFFLRKRARTYIKQNENQGVYLDHDDASSH